MAFKLIYYDAEYNAATAVMQTFIMLLSVERLIVNMSFSNDRDKIFCQRFSLT